MWLTPVILCGLTAWVIYANNMLNPAPPFEIALGVLVGALAGIPFGILRGMHTAVRPTDRRGVMYLGSSWVTLAVFAVAFILRSAVRFVAPHRGSLCERRRRRASGLRDRLRRQQLPRHFPKIRGAAESVGALTADGVGRDAGETFHRARHVALVRKTCLESHIA